MANMTVTKKDLKDLAKSMAKAKSTGKKGAKKTVVTPQMMGRF